MKLEFNKYIGFTKMRNHLIRFFITKISKK